MRNFEKDLAAAFARRDAKLAAEDAKAAEHAAELNDSVSDSAPSDLLPGGMA